MAKLTFLGATGIVTGSRFVLEVNDRKLLIDCGLFQGKKEHRLMNWDTFPVPPSEIHSVLLTHAHIDHTGYLPRFCRDGFPGKVHCTHATYDLCKILLPDSAHLQEEDAAWANKKGFTKHAKALPLYTVEDAQRALTRFAPVNYGEDLYLADDLRVEFRDAGHILGSAFIDVRTGHNNRRRKIVFSGDLGRPAKPILRDPTQAFNVDYLVLESTYGDRLHEENDNVAEALAQIIRESVERGGILIIPSFAVGRAQTLLYTIRELEEQGKIPVLPVYVDSPMAVDATHVFENRISDQNLTSRIQMIKGKALFHPQQLRLCKSVEESKAINSVQRRAILISASGMVTGGRILHHLRQRLPDEKNTVLFVGYQGEGTRGRTILNGQPTVKIHGEHIPIKAQTRYLTGYSGHADYHEILAWLMGFNRPPEKTFLVHGEPDAANSLAEKIRERYGWDVVVPKFGESFEVAL